jgi:hypothetical protein
MRRVTYSVGVSLDGYIAGPDGGFGWTAHCSSGPRSGRRSRGWCSPPRGRPSCLASGGLAEEIGRLRAGPAAGDIAIGGAALAAEAAALDLIDEYQPRVYPVLAGGGTPFFPRRERRVDLELAETGSRLPPLPRGALARAAPGRTGPGRCGSVTVIGSRPAIR